MGLSPNTNRVLVMCVGMAVMSGCMKKVDDPYAPSSYAPAVEPANEETRSKEAVAEEEAMEPAPSAPPVVEADDEMKDAPGDGSQEKAQPTRSRAPQTKSDGAEAPTGCPDQTCMKVCKSYEGTKHTACIIAYNRGCFGDQANPIDCGEFGTTADTKEVKDSNIGIMPTPKL